MTKKFEVNLFLGHDHTVSNIKKKVYEDELLRVNSQFPISNGVFDIAQTYATKISNEEIEVGFFIRNTLEKEIVIENIPLEVEDSNGNVIARKKFNFKEFGPIPSFSAAPFSIIFILDESEHFKENEKYFLKLGKVEKVDAYESVNTEIENIPEDLEFDEEQAIRNFEKRLNTLKANQFSIHLFKVYKKAEDTLICEILFRNGSNKEVPVIKLPLTIADEEGYIVSQGVFENEKGLFSVSPLKSKLMKFEVKCFKELPATANFSKYKVLFTSENI